MGKGCKASGVKKIRVHHRHSHAACLLSWASHLCKLPRFGHENIETTLNSYLYLYPLKQAELAQKLENIGF
ncbi:MAG: hypothetical protein E7512_01890 [[Clostridium] sporosphaeroides]|uniref:Integrase n=1 Tax=Faecalispora sporosphaeroides TaxID=1549 RepID=A0A928KUR4_9FIRM|nr:hypothetical protein [Faecalispora sporosphaeroides]